MIGTGRIPIVERGSVVSFHLGLGITCLNCSVTAEMATDTGDLVEFPKMRIIDLTEPYNLQRVPRTTNSLGCSLLWNGKES
jgi:hypothetical protein